MSVVSVSVLGSVLLCTDLVTDFDVIISFDPFEIDILHAQKKAGVTIFQFRVSKHVRASINTFDRFEVNNYGLSLGRNTGSS